MPPAPRWSCRSNGRRVPRSSIGAGPPATGWPWDRWASPSPRCSRPAIQPDVLFIPLAAFDRRGYRLGYGAGNVDRTLSILRGLKRIRAIGVGYTVQEEPSLPIEPHDEPLDLVVTDRDILLCGR